MTNTVDLKRSRLDHPLSTEAIAELVAELGKLKTEVARARQEGREEGLDAAAEFIRDSYGAYAIVSAIRALKSVPTEKESQK